ncbi:non-specific lipid-transfer protein-like protein At2g13820 [Pistacia vera]|uniref:non-specific lipid-transfer protein-like protein At2g13820 n=1 Tax=Pistacia vera TaxID=55513 RepID=UPI001262D042|nr:non-specific lipid-transfer protein-like protein At2g13820 [Pistacia vera]XP_031254949.1 non-specific lipid-transfer protein-like protein At2g13820 [Pistacia vera]
MAAKRIETVVILIIAATLWAGAAAQSSDCSNVLISMSPCLNYITGNSSSPSSSCCSQLSSVVKSQPQCLCQVINGGGSSLGINVNQTQAMALPSACNVQTPPVSQCNAASPSGSPSGSGGGSKTVPSTDGDSSNGNATKLTFSLLLLLLFVASTQF